MNEKDKAAFEAALSGCPPIYMISAEVFALGWRAALAHRDAQASAVNQKMLEALYLIDNALKTLGGGTRMILDGKDAVRAAIAAAEALNGGEHENP